MFVCFVLGNFLIIREFIKERHAIKNELIKLKTHAIKNEKIKWLKTQSSLLNKSIKSQLEKVKQRIREHKKEETQ